MTRQYIIRLNVDAGKYIDLEMNKKEFKEMSNFYDSFFPDKEWKTVVEST